MHYYWYLTNDGIEFLRTFLNLPAEIVPATLKKQSKPIGRPMVTHLAIVLGALRALMETVLDSVIVRATVVVPEGDFGGDKGGVPADFQPSFMDAGGRPGFGRGSGSFGAPSSG